MTQPPTPPGRAPFISRPPDRPMTPPAPPPPSGGYPAGHPDAPDWKTATWKDAIRAAFIAAMPTKAEIIDAIYRGTKDAILEAKD